MCLPPVAVALLAGSHVANTLAQRKVNKARAGYLDAEDKRQDALQDKSNNVLEGVFEKLGSEPVNQAYDDKAVSRENALVSMVDDIAPVTPTSSSAPQIVKDEATRTIADAMTEARGEAQRRAKMGAWGGTQLDSSMELKNSGDAIARIFRESQRSGNILPMELAEANTRGSNWRAVGELAGGAAQLYMLGNMFSAPGAATVNPAAAAKEGAASTVVHPQNNDWWRIA